MPVSRRFASLAAFLQSLSLIVRLGLWTEWLTNSFFRIRASPAAAEKLTLLPAETQHRLRQMLEEITELADLTPPNTGRVWVASGAPQLLTLQIGRVCVRYSISEDTRTLAIEHVIVLEDEEPLWRTG
jgi:hypothetical protein